VVWCVFIAVQAYDKMGAQQKVWSIMVIEKNKRSSDTDSADGFTVGL